MAIHPSSFQIHPCSFGRNYAQISWESILGGNKSHLHLRAGASVAGFIVDFYCHKAALVIEVDGDIHDLQQEEDARREKVLREMGLRVVRFRNEEIMKNLAGVLRGIHEQLFSRVWKAYNEVEP